MTAKPKPEPAHGWAIVEANNEIIVGTVSSHVDAAWMKLTALNYGLGKDAKVRATHAVRVTVNVEEKG